MICEQKPKLFSDYNVFGWSVADLFLKHGLELEEVD